MRFFVEDAVSAVIGVMLMLAVTIIIASTVAAFAGGASTTFEDTPAASLAVYCDGSVDDGTFNIIFDHLGGDKISTDDLKIITWIDDGSGDPIKSDHTLSSECSSLYPYLRLPYVYDSQVSGSNNSEFGEALWKPGTVAGTRDADATEEFLNIPEDKTLDDYEGSPVEVTIVYLPSGNTILKTEFLLE
ncbi:type IV pilin N-terminal domain-containing protein [Methanolacinia paynteri]|uniref:type IV pilin N-terminal domain-containing protein n=1 Tax=Methanolacinia paynteri TaxID=230356 RepID=UPI000694E11A|nr:type IV pilin N-terminal domain-containing protein [Methanolacinia paynteri]